MKTKAHQRYRSKVQKLKNGKGKIFVGVTTVMREWGNNTQIFINWANRLGLKGIDCNKYRDDKANIGTLAHAMITDHFSGKETDTSDYSQNQIDEAQNAALSFYEWEKRHEFKKVFVEKKLVSEEYEYGGTPDIYAIVDGIKELIDLKTGSGIYAEHRVQVGGGYRHLMTENNYEVDRVRILNIPRSEDENFVDEIISNTESYWNIFYWLLLIYNEKKKLKGK